MLNQERDFDEIPRKWTAVRVDETGHCGEEFVARCGGKVHQVYLFDANEVTYCCSLTPSYGLIPVEVVAEKYPEGEATREALFDELTTAMEGAEFAYMDCSTIDRLSDENKVEQVGLENDASEDEVLEHYHGSPTF